MAEADPITLDTLAIVGVGLIGGSLAKALKQAQAVRHIIGVDASKASLYQALELGVIDEVGEFADLERAEVIILATPVDALFEVCSRLSALNLRDDVVVSDVGSTKSSVLTAMRQAFGDVPSWFVPAHPIAGREKSGVGAADASLFQRHKLIITTLEQTSDEALGIISRLWHATGAMITYLSIRDHDEVLGATSHLPHVLAYVLVDMLNQDLHHDEIFTYAAGGFKDFTRIASSSPLMWRDVCLHNSDVLRQLLGQYRQRIEAFEALLANADGEAIETLFERAKSARDNHYQKELPL